MTRAIQAYHSITVAPEFEEQERLRELARHNEASALRRVLVKADTKWKGVVAKKDAALAKKDAALADKDAALAAALADKAAAQADKAAAQAEKAAQDAEIARLRALLDKVTA